MHGWAALAALVASCAAVGAVGIAACSVNAGGTGAGPDAAAEGGADVALEADVARPPDASPDVSPVDASDGGDAGDGSDGSDGSDGADGASACNAMNCGGACCGNKCVPRTCAGCAAGTVFCPYDPSAGSSTNGVCVQDCSRCVAGDAAATVACFSCTFGAPLQVCAETASQCPQDLASGACSCASGDAGECPAASEVCAQSDAAPPACLRCGQPGTNAAPCRDRKTCNEVTGSCN
jgi:hypothetical protein